VQFVPRGDGKMVKGQGSRIKISDWGIARMFREQIQAAAASPAPAATAQAAASPATRARRGGEDEEVGKPEVICLDSDEEEQPSKRAKGCARTSSSAAPRQAHQASTDTCPKKTGVAEMGDNKRQRREPAGTEERKRKENARHGQHHEGESQKGSDLLSKTSSSSGLQMDQELARSHAGTKGGNDGVQAVPKVPTADSVSWASALGAKRSRRPDQECQEPAAREDKIAAKEWLEWLSSQDKPPDATTAAAQMIFLIYAE
jgi:hypothetical protein